MIEPFIPRELGPKPWGRELLVAHTDAYTTKVSWMRAGECGPLQSHRVKDETFFLLSGQAHVFYETDGGVIARVIMKPGESYHVPPGSVHQFAAVEDCVIIEGSTPVFDDRVPYGA